MPKLTDIKGVQEKKAKKPGRDVPSVQISPELFGKVAAYNAAADAAKAAHAKMKELMPELTAEGLVCVFETNVVHADDPKQQIKSVNLTEPKTSGSAGNPEALQFTWTTKPLKLDEKAVKGFFARLVPDFGTTVDINDYAEWVLVADFDKKVFQNDKGRFDQGRFDKFLAKIQEAADELGVDNPLTLSKDFRPVKEAHERRFRELNLAQNLGLHTVLPTSTSLEPVRPEEE